MPFELGPLPRIEDLAHARRVLERFSPPDAAQAQARERMLDFLDEHPRDAHLRSCAPGHLTASALLLDATGERALLTHHAKLGRWLQLGGHCDGDANLAAVAWRELSEESGLARIEIDPTPIDLDIHLIPARPGEPAHLHLDTRFVARVLDATPPRANHESHELRWFRVEEVRRLAATDDSVLRLFERVFGG